MPSFDLVCPKCGHMESMLVSYEAAVEHTCEMCGADTDIQLAPSDLHNLPTPKFHGKVPLTEDPGFQAEWDSIE